MKNIKREQKFHFLKQTEKALKHVSGLSGLVDTRGGSQRQRWSFHYLASTIENGAVNNLALIGSIFQLAPKLIKTIFHQQKKI